MTGYTKLFASIITSSIWDLTLPTRIVWVTMLAMREQDHIVRATMKSLALFARVSEAEANSAIQELSDPDPHSRTQEFEGRRIKAVEGGWLLLNGEKYRKLLSAAERKEYNRVKQTEYRKRRKTIEHDGACAGATQAINEGFGDLRT